MTSNESIIFSIEIDDSKSLQKTAKLEKQLLSLKEERKALNKEIKAGNEITDEQAKELAKLNIQIGETSKELRRTRNETKQVAGSFGEMKTQLSRAKAELNKFKPGEAGFDEAKEKVRALNEEVSEIEQSFGVFSRNVGNYGSVLTSQLDKVGISLGGISGNAAALASGPLALVSIFAGATVAAGKYLSNLEEVRKETALLTGATGDLLNQLTGQAQALQDIFGQDTKESIKSAQAVSQAFGISLDESLNLIGQGLALGGSELDGYTNLLQEFSGVASEAGLSGEQFVSFLEGASQSGEFVFERLPDLVKDASIRLRELSDEQVQVINNLGLNGEQLRKEINEGSKTTFEAIQEVSGAIGELDPKTRAVADGLVLLGSQAEDLGASQVATIANIDTNLQTVIDSSNTYEQAQIRLIEAQKELRTITAAAFGEAGGFFGKIKTELQIIGSRLIVGVIKGFISFSNAVIDVYNNSILVRGVAGSIGLAFQNGFEIARLAANQLIDGLATGGKVIGAILTGDFQRVGAIYSDFLAETRENFTTFGKNTAENYADAFESTLKGRIEKISLDFTPSAGLAVNASGSSSTSNTRTSAGSGQGSTSSSSAAPGIFRIDTNKFKEESDIANALADADLEKAIERTNKLADAEEEAERSKKEAIYDTLGVVEQGAKAVIDGLSEESKARKAALLVYKASALAQLGIDKEKQIQNAITTAGNIAKAFPAPLGPILAVAYSAGQLAFIAASSAKSVQKINSASFQDGGFVQGPSHAQGGIPGYVKATGQAIEFEGNEYIFSQKAVNRIGLQKLNAMNFGGHVPRFMAGGSVAGNVVPSGIAGDNLGAMKAAFKEALREMPAPVTRVRDIIGEIDTFNEIENRGKI